jgi:predicted transcriptional regulator
MTTDARLRAARGLLGIDQKELAELSGIPLPAIQRMETSDGDVRGAFDTLMKVVEALQRAGVELISEHARSEAGGAGVGLRQTSTPSCRSH